MANRFQFRDRFEDLMRRNLSIFWIVRAPRVLHERMNHSTITLEIGCGTGNWTPILAQRAERVIAFDINQRRVRAACDYVKRRGLQNVEFLVASGDALPFASSSFDSAYCIDVIEHVPDDKTAVCEICRVLQDSGMAAATSLLLYRPSYFRKFEFPDHCREYTLEDFRRLFADANLQEKELFTFYSFFSTVARELEVMSYFGLGRIPTLRIILKILLSLIAHLDKFGQLGTPSGIGIVCAKPPSLF